MPPTQTTALGVSAKGRRVFAKAASGLGNTWSHASLRGGRQVTCGSTGFPVGKCPAGLSL